MKRIILLLVVSGFFMVSCHFEKSSKVKIYKAPEGELLSAKYKITADGQNVPVYIAKIGMENKADREKAMDDMLHSNLFYDIAGFAYFDIKEMPVKVVVSVNEEIEKVKILPTSFGITPEIKGKTIIFEIDKPQNLTVEINGDHIRSLHIFVNPEEKNIPNPNDPHVIYFGPGIHKVVSSVVVPDSTIVYVAGGAIVRCYNKTPWDPENLNGDKEPQQESPSFILKGKHIKFCGRGIIDQENVHRMKSRVMISVTGEDIELEGVILRNSSHWTVALGGSDSVKVDNLKILGFRANSDGVDICNSWKVLVENCFIRTLDDLVVVKTFNGKKGSGDILIQKCVLWNEVAHALSIGAEVKQVVDGVTFKDCDIIGDHCREWSLRVYNCDKGVVKNITFDNIRIEEAVKFASLWINKTMWTTDSERGHIENVTFKNITLTDSKPLEKGMEFLGFDNDHAIKNVNIENVIIQGKKITRKDIVTNDYVSDVTVK